MNWSCNRDQQIEDALRTCAGLLFLMTGDSVHAKSECRHEWTRALRYEKPIIPLLFEPDAEMPLRLEPRQYLDFTGDYKQPLARLREHMRWRSSPEGVLQGLKERFLDAERDLRRANDAERARIEEEMEDLRADGAGTVHLVVWVPWDQAEARVAAGVAAGGRVVRYNVEELFWTLADPAGNEVDVATTSAPEPAG